MSDLIDRNLIAELVDSHGNVHWEDIAELLSEQPEVRTQMSSADCISRRGRFRRRRWSRRWRRWRRKNDTY